ncbi:hypothetical protein V5799_030123 [Amblyomma americanum]|uniref:Uncharacterized protein n=1 Tax=Amblyomma americanum TaxID=6943 RepID=A0AAQ4EP28_AMBAM
MVLLEWVEVGGSGEADSWVQEGSPSHSTSVKIDTSHQFVPKGTDPAEFKRKQKELKENRLNSKINAGPQSNLLDGVTWEEVKKMQDAVASATGDQVVLVGAASKGIIQRDYQHNAMVYKTAYSKNPFDNITDSELEDYKRLVERKQRGESIDDDVPDSLKPLLVEPVAVPSQGPQHTSSPLQSPAQSPTSPASDEEVKTAVVTAVRYLQPNMTEPQIIITDDSKSSARVKRSLSSRLATEEEERIVPQQFGRRAQSERKPKRQSDAPVNGDEKLRSAESGDVSAASRSSKEQSSPVKDVEGESPKKDKKKKKGGLRTPSVAEPEPVALPPVCKCDALLKKTARHPSSFFPGLMQALPLNHDWFRAKWTAAADDDASRAPCLFYVVATASAHAAPSSEGAPSCLCFYQRFFVLSKPRQS